ncbi:MAG: thermonuclease family protein, partial [Gallionellaceae bacterium]|nr:thermonuclease family protein [Gallionellaceae bacterium]
MRTLCALLCILPLWVHAEVFDALVLFVSDGDSLTVSREGERIKIRLADIDAPEREQPWGKQSRTSLRELAGKRQVRIDSRAVDQYGRVVAQVGIEGLDINREQVRRGMAWIYSYRSADNPYQDSQDEARAAKRGLWSQPDPQPPWRWRKAHPWDGKAPKVLPRDTPVLLYDMYCGAKKRCNEMRSC